MDATMATRRIFGLEKKNRKKAMVSIEEEFYDILEKKMSRSDTVNISIQEFLSNHGVPIMLVALEPEGVRLQNLTKSDVYNLALSELFQKKGYLH